MNHLPSSSSPSNFGELDLIRFMFELHHQQIDPLHLQQMIFEHQMRSQYQYASLTPPPDYHATQPAPNYQFLPPYKPLPPEYHPSAIFQPSPAPTTHLTQASFKTEIPEPKIVFNYARSTRPPTPESETISLTPDTMTIDEADRTLELDEYESDGEGHDKLLYADRITEWCGTSVYHNLPDVTMVEYDKLLRESHMMKMEIVKKLHAESPINYDYNPNKSRIRTNYENPLIAEGRTKNNIASRRSRQRKKFQQHILQYSVDFDEDENVLLQKQEKWLRAIIENLEERICERRGVEGANEIDKLRKGSGFQ